MAHENLQAMQGEHGRRLWQESSSSVAMSFAQNDVRRWPLVAKAPTGRPHES